MSEAEPVAVSCHTSSDAGDPSTQIESSNQAAITTVAPAKKDCAIAIEIAADALTASLTNEPSDDRGLTPTLEIITAALAKAGVIHGLHEPVIATAVAKGSLPKTIIASATPAQKGADSYLEYLVKDESHSPALRKDGSVDLRDLNLIKSITANIELMRKHAATSGVDGMTVTGKKIQAEAGKDAVRLIANAGSALSATDANLLLSTRAGCPVHLENSVRVDDVLTLPEVNSTTGNIKFSGSVVVTKSVSHGYKVEATGNIVILGAVESGSLEAGGSIELKGGFMGHGQDRLSAKENITAHFIQNAIVDCGGDLMVENALMHSQVKVAGRVLVGVKHGKGKINGGEICCKNTIKARSIGSTSSTLTTLKVGKHPQMQDRINELNLELRGSQLLIDELNRSIATTKIKTSGKPSPALAIFQEKHAELMKIIAKCNEEIQSLSSSPDYLNPTCDILATDELFSSVKVELLEVKKNILEDLDGGHLTLMQIPATAFQPAVCEVVVGSAKGAEIK